MYRLVFTTANFQSNSSSNSEFLSIIHRSNVKEQSRVDNQSIYV